MRTIAVTGAASGIGRAVAQRLADAGERVISVDIRDADVVADLSAAPGRSQAVEQIEALSGGRLDGVVACAGVALPEPITVSVNFFGVVAIASGVREMLAAATAPRAVVISSEAVLLQHDPATVAACLDGDEPAAIAAAQAAPEDQVYASSKYALSRWIKREAVKPEWAGSGILLNAVAPGIVVTPMTQHLVDSEEGREALHASTPTRIGRYAEPSEIAAFVEFLVSPDNSFIVGQSLFCDGGAEATLRPEAV